MLLSFQIILALLYLFKNMMKMAHFNLADASGIYLLKAVSFVKRYLKHKGEMLFEGSFRSTGPSISSTAALRSNAARYVEKTLRKWR